MVPVNFTLLLASLCIAAQQTKIAFPICQRTSVSTACCLTQHCCKTIVMYTAPNCTTAFTVTSDHHYLPPGPSVHTS